MFVKKPEGSSSQSVKGFFDSKPVKIVGGATLVALAVIGGLTIVGSHYPGSTLSKLQDIFTLKGGYIMVMVPGGYVAYKLSCFACNKVKGSVSSRSGVVPLSRNNNRSNGAQYNRSSSSSSEHITFSPLPGSPAAIHSNGWNLQPSPYVSHSQNQPSVSGNPTFPMQHQPVVSVPSIDVTSGKAVQESPALYTLPPPPYGNLSPVRPLMVGEPSSTLLMPGLATSSSLPGRGGGGYIESPPDSDDEDGYSSY